MLLFYDTETTGFPRNNLAPDHPDQPYVVQLAATLCDHEGNIQQSIDFIIDNGVDIPPEPAAIHGIDTQKAKNFGVTPSTALNAFVSLWLKADKKIAHNEQFDAKMMRIYLARHKSNLFTLRDAWDKDYGVCTMKMANPYTEAIGTLKPKNKWPKLSEALDMLMDHKLENAHSAMPDVLGCMKLYFHLKALEQIEQQQLPQ